jgi:predicted TIM-barrel enzyme
MTRNEILESLRKEILISRSIPIEIAGSDSNHSPPVAGQNHLTFLYNTAGFPGAGAVAGLLPSADANGALLDFVKTGLPTARPLIAGVCGSDPFRFLNKLLEEIKGAGFVGVQNFPTCGMIEGGFRQHLENSELGYAREVEMIFTAHSLDLLTMPLVFTVEDGVRMLEAGADILVLHPGANAFRKSFSLKKFAFAATEIAHQIKANRRKSFVLRYNGPGELADPEASY